jgi:hypothetical protein
MPAKNNNKTNSRTKSGSKLKSKLSTKLIAAIIIGIVAVAGIVIIFSSYAAGAPAYQYSYNTACTADKKTTTVKSDLGSGSVTVGWDTKSDCLKDSTEEQAYRLNRAVTNEQPPKARTNYDRYKELVQKMAGDRVPPPELVPQSFLDQYKDKSDAEFITQVFKNVLYRTPGDNGASWAADMKKNGWSRRDAVFIISSSPEAKNKNVGRFTEFLRNNPEPVAIKPNAQITQDYRLKLINGKIEEMKILNYVILVGRNEINATNNYEVAVPKKEEVSKNMIKLAEIKQQVDDLVRDAKALTKRSSDISDSAILTAQARSDELLNSSWSAAVEAGTKTDNLVLTAFYTKVQQEQFRRAKAAAIKKAGRPKKTTAQARTKSTLTPTQQGVITTTLPAKPSPSWPPPGYRVVNGVLSPEYCFSPIESIRLQCI